MTEPAGLTVALRETGPVPLDVEFACGPADVTAVFGPSGAGKTTVLRCIAGLHRPAAGRVACGDEVWLDTQAGINRPAHLRGAGFVFQDYALFPHLTALGNVEAALDHQPRAARPAEARRLLALMDLTGLAGRRPGTLSGGERQRLALARAMARTPKVLLLDEPFAATDRALRRRLQHEVQKLRRALHLPIILVTHDFDDVVRLATHVVVIDAGRTVAQGAIEDLTSRPDFLWLRAAAGLGSVFSSTVTSIDAVRGLAAIACGSGTLLVPADGLEAGQSVTVRMPAREVILARSRRAGPRAEARSEIPGAANLVLPDPRDAGPSIEELQRALSLHNILEALVVSIAPVPHTQQVVVQLALGHVRLLAEVTRDAVHKLELVPGSAVLALVKSVGIEVTSRSIF